jgi:hypothetical protein
MDAGTVQISLNRPPKTPGFRDDIRTLPTAHARVKTNVRGLEKPSSLRLSSDREVKRSPRVQPQLFEDDREDQTKPMRLRSVATRP